MSGDLPGTEAQATALAVRVEVIFHVANDQQAQTVAAKMVDRAHEIANLPECECDVDVSIERTPLAALANPLDSLGGPSPGPTKI